MRKQEGLYLKDNQILKLFDMLYNYSGSIQDGVWVYGEGSSKWFVLELNGHYLKFYQKLRSKRRTERHIVYKNYGRTDKLYRRRFLKNNNNRYEINNNNEEQFRL